LFDGWWLWVGWVIYIKRLCILYKSFMSSSLTEEDNARCWEYVMKFSLSEIHSNKDSELNQICSSYIKSKESFVHYVEDKRRSIRDKEKKEEEEEKKVFSEPPPIIGRNFIRKSS